MPHYMLTPTQPFIIWESRGSAVKASETPEAGTAPTAQRVPAAFRDNAERAEALAHALATTIKQEIERLKNERRNDSEGQAEIDFLEVVSATLDQIVDAIEQARQAVTSQDRDQKFAEAEKLASSLAKAGRDFAERNYERVVDFGGYSALAVLGTQLFTTLFGVPVAEALAAQLLLLGFTGVKLTTK